MAAYRRVYDSRHLQADCQEPGSAQRNPALGNRVWAAFTFYHWKTCQKVQRRSQLSYVCRNIEINSSSHIVLFRLVKSVRFSRTSYCCHCKPIMFCHPWRIKDYHNINSTALGLYHAPRSYRRYQQFRAHCCPRDYRPRCIGLPAYSIIMIANTHTHTRDHTRRRPGLLYLYIRWHADMHHRQLLGGPKTLQFVISLFVIFAICYF